jgi:hypothetical protein
VSTPIDPKVVWGDVLAEGFILAFHGLMVMLLFGVLHSNAHGIPAFGYWTCVFIAFVAAGVSRLGSFNLIQRVTSLTPLYGKKVDASAVAKVLSEFLAKGAK